MSYRGPPRSDGGQSSLPPGTQLNGTYEIGDLISSGGMGEVYTAHNIATGDPVAIKVVLPEYAFTGFPLGENRALWRAKAAFDPGGREYEALSAMAQGARVFLAVNAYETDKAFPELYFQTTTILSPAGDPVLRYRRMISLYAPTPFDVWDKFLGTYGYDAVFPVARTEIGTLAAIASEEVLYPEIAHEGS